MLKWFGKSSSILGVDIGTSSVKVVQIKVSGKRLILEKVGIAPVKLDGTRTDRIEPTDTALTDALKAALAESGSSIKDVCCSIAGESVIVRYLPFPDMNDTELESAVKMQAEEYIPFRLEEVNLDFFKLNSASKESGKGLDILLVAVRKDLVARRVDILKLAGLNPMIMDVDSFAILNSVEGNYTFKPDEVIAIVNIGATFTTINISENGISKFARDISIGGNSVTQTIASKMGITLMEAEKVKIEEAVITSQDSASAAGEPSNVAEAIKSTVEKLTGEKLDDESRKAKLASIIRQPTQNLITEIRRSLQFFENQPNGKPVSRILLCGGGSKLSNLDQYMSERLGITVEVANPLSRVEMASSVNKSSEAIKNISPQLVVAIGLGLRRLGDK